MTILQVIHREGNITSNGGIEQPLRVTLNKKNKKNGQCDVFVLILLKYIFGL